MGSTALLVGYVVQAIALDHGRLAIIQPLLVSTVVFALPLGYFLTAQEVGLRQIVGAAVVVLGLAMYAIFGDPAGGNENAPNDEWAIALGIVGAVCVILYMAARRSDAVRQAAYYGVISGILFGVSACLVKPTLEMLHDGGVDAVLSHWEFYGMAITGIVAFALQQVSLTAGYLATSVATVSVSNPIVSVVLGTSSSSTSVSADRRGTWSWRCADWRSRCSAPSRSPSPARRAAANSRAGARD